jgi:hypothetical protein
MLAEKFLQKHRERLGERAHNSSTHLRQLVFLLFLGPPLSLGILSFPLCDESETSDRGCPARRSRPLEFEIPGGPAGFVFAFMNGHLLHHHHYL